jgi:hypothetical protein
MDPESYHLLVMGSVEDPNATAFGQLRVDAPQEVVIEVLARGLPERHDLDALGVHARHHVLDRGVLARGVERLEHDQEGVRVARP